MEEGAAGALTHQTGHRGQGKGKREGDKKDKEVKEVIWEHKPPLHSLFEAGMLCRYATLLFCVKGAGCCSTSKLAAEVVTELNQHVCVRSVTWQSGT